MTQTNEKNIFLKEFERTCTTLELSCRNRQRDDDRGAPPALNSDGEINKFDTLRFLACHLPRDPLASVFKLLKVNKDQADEIHEEKKAFFAVWKRLHQLVAQAITQVKHKYNRMNATARAASREEDVPQYRDANSYQINQTTPQRAEQGEAQRGARNERNEKRNSIDPLELNQKNEMQKKGNHINATVATSQIGYVLQTRIDEHVTYSQPFVLPAKLTYDERTSRWTRTASDEPTSEGKEDERGEAMDIGSTRNSSRLSHEDQDPYEGDDDSSRRESAGSSLMGSRSVTPPPDAWEAAAEDDSSRVYDEGHDGNDGKSSDSGFSGRSSGKGGSNEPHDGSGGKGSSRRHQGSGKDKGSSSRLHDNDDGTGRDSRLSGRDSGKGGSNELRDRNSGGKGGSSELHDGDGSKGGNNGLEDDGSSSAGSKSSRHSTRHANRKINKKHQRAEQRRASSNDSSADQQPANDARAGQREKKQKQE